MKNIKGIYQDSDPGDTPPGYIFYAKNVILTEKKGAIENEEGLSDFFLPGVTGNQAGTALPEEIVGICTLNKGEVLIFLRNTSTGVNRIVISDQDQNVTEIISDTSLGEAAGALNFSITNPIEAEYYLNFQGERVVVWIANNEVPRILNIDDPETSLGNLNLFLDTFFHCAIVEVSNSGGSLPSGSYSFVFRYKSADGSYTSWSSPSRAKPITAGNAASSTSYEGAPGGTATAKSLEINTGDLDTSFKFLEVAVIKSINSQITVASIGEYSIEASGIDIIYTGNEQETDLLLEEIIVPTARYSRAKTITQLDNRLYLGNLVEEDSDIDYQIYANNIQLSWRAVPVYNLPTTETREYLSSQKTFMPGEVYAFYIEWQLANGSWSKAYHIPGRPLVGSDRGVLAITNARGIDDPGGTYGAGNYPKYMIQDTCTYGLVSGIPAGSFGAWENITEEYPNTAEFAAPRAGGVNVRHHKFPTLQFLELNGPAGIGDSESFLLEVVADNVEIPAALANKGVTGYRILHAKRDLANSTQISQSLLMFAGVGSTGSIGNRKYFPAGGNWIVNSTKNSPFAGNNNKIYAGAGDVEVPTAGFTHADWVDARGKYIRFHGFNLLIDKPGIDPDLLRLEYKLGLNDNSGGGVSGTGRLDALPNLVNGSKSDDDFRYTLVDYLNNTFHGKASISITGPNDYGATTGSSAVSNIAVQFESYVPNGVVLDLNGDYYNNVAGEEHVLLQNLYTVVNHHPNSTEFEYYKEITAGTNAVGEGFFIGGNPSDGSPGDTTTITGNHVCTLVSTKTDIYKTFYRQTLNPLDNCYESAGGALLPAGILPSGAYKGGDVFTGDYSINTIAPLDENYPLFGGNGAATTGGEILGEGCKAAHRMPVCFCPKNVILRYNEDANIQGYYFPKNELRRVENDGSVGLIYFGRQALDADFELFYNEDHSLRIPQNVSVNEIFDPFTESDLNFPTLIVRSIPQDSNRASVAWRTFLLQDTYTISSNHGELTNLQAVGNQRLYIHTEDSLFITKDRTTLKGDIQSVTLGSSDIFEVPPFEVLSTKNGYAGTQHKFSCVVTKMGYAFVDAKQGKVFIHDGQQLDEISKKGLRTFFRDKIIPTVPDTPFNDSGISIAFDEKYNRLLISHTSGGRNSTDSWTVSYSPELDGFISFHDYEPGYLFSNSENRLYSVAPNTLSGATAMSRIILHNSGLPGTYYSTLLDAGDPDPMLLDIIYNPEPYKTKVFSNLQWDSQVSDYTTGVPYKDQTLDYLTFWSQNKTTGRIPLTRLQNLHNNYTQNLRSTETTWNFNNFRNIAKPYVKFLQGFENDFGIDTAQLDAFSPWYNRSRFIDDFITCRFEYMNTNGYRFSLLDSEMLYRLSFR